MLLAALRSSWKDYTGKQEARPVWSELLFKNIFNILPILFILKDCFVMYVSDTSLIRVASRHIRPGGPVPCAQFLRVPRRGSQCRRGIPRACLVRGATRFWSGRCRAGQRRSEP